MITVLSGGTGTPKLLQGIKEIVDAGWLKVIPSIHRETIDAATARKKKKIK